MEGRIPHELVNQVVQAHNIIDIVGQYVALKRSGRNYFGLCPFHQEKSPSFSVSEQKQIYHCFGCKVGGDVIQFVVEIEKYTFVEAVRYLASQKGIYLPESTSTSTRSQQDGEIEQMKKALELSAKFYHHVLTNTDVAKSARQYLFGRGITKETINTFQIGFAPNSNHYLLRFLKRRGFHEQILSKIGLVGLNSTNHYYDYFRNRIMFPIHDATGNVIGFGGRSIGETKPKYLNSPEHVLFHKGNHLYNFNRARSWIRKEQQVVLLEGYMDIVMAWQAGVHMGVASLGTALTENQSKLLRKVTDTVIICYDADLAGQSAALKGIEILKKHQHKVKVAQMPNGLDPDDYIRQYGVSSFKEDILANALSLVQFKLERLKRGYNLQDEDDRTKYVLKAIQEVAKLPHAIEQDHYLRNIAEEFKISFDSIKEEQQKIKAKNRKDVKGDKDLYKWNNVYYKLSKHLSNQSRTLSITEKSERILIAYMMRDRSIAQWVQETLGDRFCTEIYAALVAYLYSYYARGNSENVGYFISTLEDKELISKASELAMLDLPDEVTHSALSDYVKHILNYPLQKEIEEKEKLVRHLSKADQPVKAAELTLEITQLKKKLLGVGNNEEGGKTSWQTNKI